jgi:crotonobetainyl-CoA:carnitine CoA-transferase CaiB-like acyl-CoA transferase
MAPLDGLRVVEVALGVSAVGAGLAGSLPGRLLGDLGADVTRVQPERRGALDAGVEFARVWDRDKEIIEVGDAVPARAVQTITGLAKDADVLFLAGGEELLEHGGLRSWKLARSNQRLVVARVRPSYNAMGPIPDIELLVQARSGLLTQVRGHRPGPAFCDLTVAGAGAGLSAAVGALACLYERETTGLGGWSETSLYDGIQAILPNIIGRVEHHSPSTTLIWKSQGPAERLAYRCADGEYVQLWFGARGAYEAFLEHIGDPPSENGYLADMVNGALAERDQRWAVTFAVHDRDWWLKDLAGQKFRCEPVLRPGEALRDPHVVQAGLSITREDSERGPITMLGAAVQVAAIGDGAPRSVPGHARLLEGVRVLDLSAYLAGPVATRVLAGLGADVVKVEPPTGDAHRSVEPMFAAGQLGKRAVTLDLKSPDAPAVLERLFRWSDVVHHNSRVGLAERLGYDEATVRAANPDVIYSFASGFGQHGPRAPLAANDQLMQALSGVEAAQGGAGQPPAYQPWGAIDVTSGWMAACGVLAALYAQRRRGGGQSVAASLLGAALTLKSGAFLVGDHVVSGPVLDAGQTGYGAAYRIYVGRDGAWFALAVPDQRAWDRLRDVLRLDGLPATPPPLRTGASGPQPEEALLEAAFQAMDAAEWVAKLRAAGVPAEPVVEADRSEFAAGFLDDPVNRQLGRVVTHHWGHLGRVDQPWFPPRLGPAPRPPVRTGVPGLGEHTVQVLDSLGFDTAHRAALAASGAVRAV